MQSDHPAQPTPLLGVVGWSGSGKTTLLETLVGALTQQGWRVNIVKHSHHDVLLEPPHKDSARLRAAGAAEVMLATPFRYAVMHELRGAPEPTLTSLLERLGQADLTLVEGYRWAPIPKLEVYRPAAGQPALYLSDVHIIAVASDGPRPDEAPSKLVWLDLNAPDSILAWLRGYARPG